jgi:hypothetical protein
MMFFAFFAVLFAFFAVLGGLFSSCISSMIQLYFGRSSGAGGWGTEVAAISWGLSESRSCQSEGSDNCNKREFIHIVFLSNFIK